MSFISRISDIVSSRMQTRCADARRPETSAPQHAASDCFVKNSAKPDTSWWKGRPLSEARNAHSTNTKEHFDEAIRNGSNWLEGDIRQEINSDALEMRHDQGHEAGDNLTLGEWLQKGKESGRGLKLDVKEGEHMARILDETEQARIPSERLMFNLGDAEMKQWAPEIRRRFPNAILAVNPPSGEGKLTSSQVNAMIDNAKAGGHPVTFVVKHNQLTPSALTALRQHGTISVWNTPGDISGDRIDDVTRNLRGAGVDGVIDLRPPLSTGDKIEVGWNKAKSFVNDQLDRFF